jgi:hypothetical protein
MPSGEAVKLMTVHAAKGLEFPYVFLVSMEEGVFPSKKTRDRKGMEEERRLAFVAVTRAKDGLFISDSEGKNFDGSFRFPSRFILDIDKDLLNYETELPIAKVQGAIALFDLLADGGCIGIYHREVAYLYLYLSRLQWEYRQKDEAFVSLDLALEQARKYDRFMAEENPRYTSPLLKHAACKAERFSAIPLAKGLPASWPMWCNPDYSAVEQEIKADPRWEKWVEKTMSK